MSFRNIIYFIKEAWKSLARNRILSIATISTVAICILILGIAVLMILNAGNFMNRLESDVEMVAFLDKALTRSQISDIEEQIVGIGGIKSVDFISKEKALKDLQKSFGGKEYDLGTTIGNNPLPNSYKIKADDPHQVPNIAARVKKIHGVYKVNYGQGIVERLFTVTKWLRTISFAFIILLALGAIFLIATTIRLAIFARRKEIYLMKLIGATDWFIRWPFFIEGVLLGLCGGLIAVGVLAAGYTSLLNKINALYFLPLVTNMSVLGNIYISLLFTGALLGVLGTYISLNRFLDV
ncbi:MAG: permease-like cell division protein FtsX [Syntrophomonadaceae bacterium]|nr:permease-like cell division protein FtsX [Syntrophomonadaceae bacterium]